MTVNGHYPVTVNLFKPNALGALTLTSFKNTLASETTPAYGTYTAAYSIDQQPAAGLGDWSSPG